MGAGMPVQVPPPVAAGGLFGRGKKELEKENTQLRQELNRLMGMDVTAMATEAATLKSTLQQSRDQYQQLQAQLVQLQAEIVRTTGEAELQEVGIYVYQHPLADAVAYKARLAELSDRIKSVARIGTAVQAASEWTVNGSVAEGNRMIKEYSKLMLRAYNAEADNCVVRVQPHRLHTTTDRLTKVAETIAKLGKTMGIRISPEYHHLRIQEIQLTADHRAKVEEEKERIREEREQQREERAAALEFEREKARLAKERSHYEAALAKLAAKGDSIGMADINAKLTQIDDAIAGRRSQGSEHSGRLRVRDLQSRRIWTRHGQGRNDPEARLRRSGTGAWRCVGAVPLRHPCVDFQRRCRRPRSPPTRCSGQRAR